MAVAAAREHTAPAAALLQDVMELHHLRRRRALDAL